MDTKSYLNQISLLDRKINNKLSELSQLKDLACSLSAVENKERVKSSPDFDLIGKKYAKIDELERTINNLVDEFVDKKAKIISQIDGIEQECYYQVLFARYIEKKTFEKIADEMNYSFRNITRIHGKALREFEKKYGQEYLWCVLECPIACVI